MSADSSQIVGHAQFRILEELDPTQTAANKKGLQVHHNLSSLDRILAWSQGKTVEFKIGNKEYVVSRQSVEDFLLRAGSISTAEKKAGVPYEALVQKMKQFMSKHKDEINQKAQQLLNKPAETDEERLRMDLYSSLKAKKIEASIDFKFALPINVKEMMKNLEKEIPSGKVHISLRTLPKDLALTVVNPGSGLSSLSDHTATVAQAVFETHVPTVRLEEEVEEAPSAAPTYSWDMDYRSDVTPRWGGLDDAAHSTQEAQKPVPEQANQQNGRESPMVILPVDGGTVAGIRAPSPLQMPPSPVAVPRASVSEAELLAIRTAKPTWILKNGNYGKRAAQKPPTTLESDLATAWTKNSLGKENSALYFYVAKRCDALLKSKNEAALQTLKGNLARLPQDEIRALQEIAKNNGWVTARAKQFFGQLAR